LKLRIYSRKGFNWQLRAFKWLTTPRLFRWHVDRLYWWRVPAVSCTGQSALAKPKRIELFSNEWPARHIADLELMSRLEPMIRPEHTEPDPCCTHHILSDEAA